MIRRIDLRGTATERGAVDYRAAVPRADFDVEAAVPAVHEICEAVRTRGLEAIREYSERFDGVALDDIRVPAEAIGSALERLDPGVRAGLEESIRRLRATCAAELAAPVDGTRLLAAIERIRLIRGGGYRFVLPIELGESVIADDVEPGELRAALAGCGIRV